MIILSRKRYCCKHIFFYYDMNITLFTFYIFTYYYTTTCLIIIKRVRIVRRNNVIIVCSFGTTNCFRVYKQLFINNRRIYVSSRW